MIDRYINLSISFLAKNYLASAVVWRPQRIYGMSKNRIEAEDEMLVLACRGGDATAWETLVDRYQRLIYTIPRRAGLDDDLCGEVFQRTFTALWKQIDRIEQPGRVRSWLVTTARRETMQLARRQAVMLPLELEHDPQKENGNPEMVDPAVLPDAAIIQLEEQHTVRVVMSALDKRCLQLLTLLFYQPTPAAYEDIAKLLGISAGSIGPTRARCLQKLRRLLQDADF